MLARLLLVAVVFAGATLWAGAASAQVAAADSADSARAAPPPKPPPKPRKPSKFFYGGGVSLMFGSTTRVSVSPLIGYQALKLLSVGTQLNYDYTKQRIDRTEYALESYGMSLFGRVHIKNFYVHVEPAVYNQENVSATGEVQRNTIPYGFVGGGAFYPIAPRMRAYIQITYDIIRDSHSPYRGSEQFVTTGIAIGP